MPFTADQRLRRSGDFGRIREEGLRINCGPFLAFFLPSGENAGPRRVGIIASRKVGKAVVRNRAKRIFRELFRHHQEQMPGGCDLVIIVRRSAVSFRYEDLEKRFLKACRKSRETFSDAD